MKFPPYYITNMAGATNTKINDQILVMVKCENMSCPHPPKVITHYDKIIPPCMNCKHFHFCSTECHETCWPIHKIQCLSGILPKLRYEVILKNIMMNGPPQNKIGNDLILLNRNETCSIEFEIKRSAINFPFPAEFWEKVGEKPGKVIIVRSLFIFIPSDFTFDLKSEIKITEEKKIGLIDAEYKSRIESIPKDGIDDIAKILFDLFVLKTKWMFNTPHNIEENFIPLIKAKWDGLTNKNEKILSDKILYFTKDMDVLTAPLFRMWVNKYMDINKDILHVAIIGNLSDPII